MVASIQTDAPRKMYIDTLLHIHTYTYPSKRYTYMDTYKPLDKHTETCR